MTKAIYWDMNNEELKSVDIQPVKGIVENLSFIGIGAPDWESIAMPEYEARLAAALPGRDFAVIDRDGEPVLAIRGEPAERAEITAAIGPATRDLPRGQRPAGILFLDDPLPRTATGKIKRWEIQQKAVEA